MWAPIPRLAPMMQTAKWQGRVILEGSVVSLTALCRVGVICQPVESERGFVIVRSVVGELRGWMSWGKDWKIKDRSFDVSCVWSISKTPPCRSKMAADDIDQRKYSYITKKIARKPGLKTPITCHNINAAFSARQIDSMVASDSTAH